LKYFVFSPSDVTQLAISLYILLGDQIYEYLHIFPYIPSLEVSVVAILIAIHNSAVNVLKQFAILHPLM
jgi:hypothetical protein